MYFGICTSIKDYDELYLDPAMYYYVPHCVNLFGSCLFGPTSNVLHDTLFLTSEDARENIFMFWHYSEICNRLF